MVNDIYAALISAGLCRSQRQFSRDWLGAAPNYYAMFKGRRIGHPMLVRLHRRLSEMHQHELAHRVLGLLLSEDHPAERHPASTDG